MRAHGRIMPFHDAPRRVLTFRTTLRNDVSSASCSATWSTRRDSPSATTLRTCTKFSVVTVNAARRGFTSSTDTWRGFVGDGVKVYFGYPKATEHDAEHAVRAALEIISRVSALDVLPGLKLRNPSRDCHGRGRSRGSDRLG